MAHRPGTPAGCSELTRSSHSAGSLSLMLRAVVALVILGIVFVPIERLRPVRRGQKLFRPVVRTDAVHFVVTGTLGTIALIILAVMIALPLQRLTPDALRQSVHFHHWHHSGDPDARDKNFAGMFPWLDRLFGTHHAPTAQWPEIYGIDDPMPAGYLRQLQSPFVSTAPARAA